MNAISQERTKRSLNWGFIHLSTHSLIHKYALCGYYVPGTILAVRAQGKWNTQPLPSWNLQPIRGKQTRVTINKWTWVGQMTSAVGGNKADKVGLKWQFEVRWQEASLSQDRKEAKFSQNGGWGKCDRSRRQMAKKRCSTESTSQRFRQRIRKQQGHNQDCKVYRMKPNLPGLKRIGGIFQLFCIRFCGGDIMP